jgi:hypothetical protein
VATDTQIPRVPRPQRGFEASSGEQRATSGGQLASSSFLLASWGCSTPHEQVSMFAVPSKWRQPAHLRRQGPCCWGLLLNHPAAMLTSLCPEPASPGGRVNSQAPPNTPRSARDSNPTGAHFSSQCYHLLSTLLSKCLEADLPGLVKV